MIGFILFYLYLYSLHFIIYRILIIIIHNLYCTNYQVYITRYICMYNMYYDTQISGKVTKYGYFNNTCS